MPSTNSESFRAPRWLRNRHIQTLGAALPLHAPTPFTPPGAVDERVVFAMGDGDAIVGRAWWHPGGAPRTTALVIHGVGGSSESRYVVRAARAMHRAGHHVVRVSLRGAGDGMPLARAMYHAGMSDDPRRVVVELSRDPRVASIGVVGFSLGGNVSLKLAGELGGDVPAKLAAVAAVSAPLDLVEVSKVLERLRTLPYRAWVLKGLVRQAVDFARAHPNDARFDPKELWRARTIRDYDQIVVVPTYGFRDAYDYYERASAGPHLRGVRVPTLIVHADDDPMVPGHTVRPFLRDLPPSIEVAWSDNGGHVGWYAGLDEDRWVETWAMKSVRRFFERHLAPSRVVDRHGVLESA
jgi:predicted alpha/beta-fold hydrolase